MRMTPGQNPYSNDSHVAVHRTTNGKAVMTISVVLLTAFGSR